MVSLVTGNFDDDCGRVSTGGQTLDDQIADEGSGGEVDSEKQSGATTGRAAPTGKPPGIPRACRDAPSCQRREV